jgi:hypothetical protein
MNVVLIVSIGILVFNTIISLDVVISNILDVKPVTIIQTVEGVSSGSKLLQQQQQNHSFIAKLSEITILYLL